jgi:hypothetical protein
MVRTTVVVAVSEPEVPVTVTVVVPTVAELLAVRLNTLLPLVGFVAKAAVTPEGRPDAVSVTLPVNPFWSETAIVDVPEPPSITIRDAGEALRVKLETEVAVPLNEMLCLAGEPFSALSVSSSKFFRDPTASGEKSMVKVQD